MSPVSSYISLEYISRFGPGIYILKIQRMVIASGGRYAQVPVWDTTSSFSSKGIVWINERLFIAGTKCSDMPEMSKPYYAPLRGPLFRDKNDDFMPLQWKHKYHFKPCL